ncbi:MAG: AlkZ family DNA glycosylase [Candidatus Heimdallarchaeota archaeon]|nr:MAG: AlkZ family DNA glycosylase [Candidatus Heimdallarchaeota archaeon]
MNDINKLGLYKQHLSEDKRTQDLIEVVQEIAGLHATIPRTPYLSLFARINNFTKELLDEELYIKKRLGKIRCVRRTLYIFPQEMIPAFHMATTKMVEKLTRKSLEYQGISFNTYQNISESILRILKEKNEEMTASEIKKALKTKLNLSNILYLMCDQRLLIRGKPRKYFLFYAYFPRMDFSLSEHEAITQLVRYYLQTFGPVSEEDVVWWTGLGKTQIKKAIKGIQDEIVQVRVTDLEKNLLMSESNIKMFTKITLEKKVVNLLPTLDSYIMGYKERERYFIPNNHYNHVFDRTGNATSIILMDGQIIGVWDVINNKKPLIKLFLFKEVNDNVIGKIYQKAKQIGTFISDKEVTIKECNSMIPLTERTAGSFMSPLRDS